MHSDMIEDCVAIDLEFIMHSDMIEDCVAIDLEFIMHSDMIEDCVAIGLEFIMHSGMIEDCVAITVVCADVLVRLHNKVLVELITIMNYALRTSQQFLIALASSSFVFSDSSNLVGLRDR